MRCTYQHMRQYGLCHERCWMAFERRGIVCRQGTASGGSGGGRGSGCSDYRAPVIAQRSHSAAVLVVSNHKVVVQQMAMQHFMPGRISEALGDCGSCILSTTQSPASCTQRERTSMSTSRIERRKCVLAMSLALQGSSTRVQ